MKLPFSRLSEDALLKRYARIAASFSPDGKTTDYPDQITWGALRLANQEWLDYYDTKLVFSAATDRRILLGGEGMRLVIDGYILSRIENGTENRLMRFALVASDRYYEAGEFALVAASAIIAGVHNGRFLKKPASGVAKVLRRFALDACENVLDNIVDMTDDNARTTGEAFNRAVNLGREVAIMEDFYLNPKMRGSLLKIRGSIRREALMELRQLQDQISSRGVTLPSDFAEQIMARAREAIELYGQD